MKQTLQILALFLAAQAIGAYVGITLIGTSIAYPEIQQFNVAPDITGGSASPWSSAFFLVYVLIGALVMVLVLKYYKGDLLFKLIEASTIFIACNLIFFVLLLGVPTPYDVVLAISLSAIITAAKFFFPQLKNFAAVLASAGVGAIFGFSLDFTPALLFIIGLSLYDFLSVFWTKHMVFMAKELSSKNLAFSVAATEMAYDETTKKEEKSTLELGTGDLAIPLMLAVSAFKLNYNPLDTVITIFGGTVGLTVVLYYVTQRRTFLPALPPISFFALLALAIGKLLITHA